jgi:hypothetical protein
LRIGGVEVLEGGFEVQHRGGDFHREFGPRRLAERTTPSTVAQRLRQRPLAGCSLSSVSLMEWNWSPTPLSLWRRRPTAPTRFPWPAMRLRSLREQHRIEAAELRCLVVDRLEAAQPVGLAHAASAGASAGLAGTACAQKNSRSCASRSDTPCSPLASVAYCSSTRDAARLTYRSAGSRPSASASK